MFLRILCRLPQAEPFVRLADIFPDRGISLKGKQKRCSTKVCTILVGNAAASSRTAYRLERRSDGTSFRAYSVAPPCRKKFRLLRLFACKRAHDVSAALSIFCGADGEQMDAAVYRNPPRRTSACRYPLCKEKGLNFRKIFNFIFFRGIPRTVHLCSGTLRAAFPTGWCKKEAYASKIPCVKPDLNTRRPKYVHTFVGNTALGVPKEGQREAEGDGCHSKFLRARDRSRSKIKIQ